MTLFARAPAGLRRDIKANGHTLHVDVTGPEDGRPIMLVMGLGMQLTGWPDDFVEQLVACGFRVIRFDNRDAGLSQDFDHVQTPNLLWQTVRYSLRMKVKAVYTLSDMAQDAIGVLDALRIPSAHVCGASMGGMIAQLAAIEHPDRVGSLTLMMTSSGGRSLPGPSAQVRALLLGKQPDPADLDAVIAHHTRIYDAIASPRFRRSADDTRAEIRRYCERAYRPAGTLRQLMAVAAGPPRTRRLSGIRCPTVIIHGSDDPLIPVECGLDLVRRIPDAELFAIHGMGHDLPRALWPRFVDAIDRTAQRAEVAEATRRAGSAA